MAAIVIEADSAQVAMAMHAMAMTAKLRRRRMNVLMLAPRRRRRAGGECPFSLQLESTHKARTQLTH
jgi:hypothetical protein